MTSKPRILITNDDGVQSPGILAAAGSLHELADVCIMAPKHQQSAMGRAQSIHSSSAFEPHPLTVNEQAIKAFACDASPAAVIGHGLNITEAAPQLVVSGINYGENLGTSITSSGTVGAAMEAASRNIPAIAISLQTPIEHNFTYSEQNWEAAQYFLQYFAQIILEKGLPTDVHLLKIDVPSEATSLTPWKLTRLSPNSYYEPEIDAPCMESKLSDTRFCKCHHKDSHGTDVHALCVENVVSVTPLTLDLTARSEFSKIEDWLAR